MKPRIAILRFDDYINAIYIGDLINAGLTFDEHVENVITSIKLFNSLGFIIHPDKSIFFINLSCVIPLYLKFGLEKKIKTFCLTPS